MPYKLYCKFIVFAIAAITFASCMSQKSSVARKQTTEQNDIINYGKKYLHKPYRYAGKGPNSFDCSGFTSFVFKEFGYNLNSSSVGQSQQGIPITKKEELQVGDLVFFEGRSHNGRVGHVGIVSEVRRNGSFKFLHASTQHGVIFSSSNEPYYRSRYLRGGRVLKDAPKRERKLNQQQTADAYLTQTAAISQSQSNKASESSQRTVEQKVTHIKNGETGAVMIHTRSANTRIEDPSIEPDQPNKPASKKKAGDKEKKEPNSKKQIATAMSEESLLPSPAITNHVVKPGETLFSISKKYKCSVDEIQNWNPSLSGSLIQAGDKLNIYQ